MQSLNDSFNLYLSYKNIKNFEKALDVLMFIEKEVEQNFSLNYEIMDTLLNLNDYEKALSYAVNIFESIDCSKEEKSSTSSLFHDYLEKYVEELCVSLDESTAADDKEKCSNLLQESAKMFALTTRHVELSDEDYIRILNKVDELSLHVEGSALCDTIPCAGKRDQMLYTLISITYRHSGLPYKALGAAQQGLNFFPTDPWLHDNIARAYFNLNLMDMAANHWGIALQMSKSLAERSEFTKMLCLIQGYKNNTSQKSFYVNFNMPIVKNEACNPSGNCSVKDILPISPSDSIKLVCIDIWDTVLRRHCHPDEVKFDSARFLLLHYFDHIKPPYRDMNSLFRARLSSENRCKKTVCFEYSFADVAQDLVREVFHPGFNSDFYKGVEDSLLTHELQFEIAVTTPDKFIESFLTDQMCINAVFVSDYYHSTDYIKSILAAHGLLKYFVSGYSSSDLSLNKRSGGVFDFVMQNFNVNPHEILHIGDNIISDYETPKGKGLETYLYDKASEKCTQEWFYEAFLEKLEFDSPNKHLDRVLAVLEQVVDDRSENLEKAHSDLFSLGVRLSPIFFGFILRIIEQSIRRGVSCVHFLTREGVFFKKVYDDVVNLDPYVSSYVKSNILEVSRLSTFGPSLSQVDRTSLMRLWTQYSRQTPKAFCLSLNLPIEETKAIFVKHDIVYDELIDEPWNNLSFLEAIESDDFSRIFNQNCSQQKKMIKKYLDHNLFGSETIHMIVDIGWRGTIQDNLSHLCDSYIVGEYLGLDTFLNTQPTNSTKNGWLFNFNQGLKQESFAEIAPLEMLSNCPGGSSVSYCFDDDKVIAVKEKDPEEDSIYYNYIQYVQQGILSALPDLVKYTRYHALTSEDFRDLAIALAEELLQSPTESFANAFFELKHNETFGVGQYERMVSDGGFLFNKLHTTHESKVYSMLLSHFKQSRWLAGLVKTTSFRSYLKDDANVNIVNHMPSFVHKKLFPGKSKKISIYTPPPLKGSGGHRTIYNLVKKLLDKGCDVSIFLEQIGDGLPCVEQFLGDYKAPIYTGWIPTKCDYSLATIAHSATYISQFNTKSLNGYLVQDWEAFFNPVGDVYLLNEVSYAQDMSLFTIGNWLSHVIGTMFNAPTTSSGLGVDLGTYFYNKTKKKNHKICFLHQPEKPRRCTDLCLQALKLVAHVRPDIQVEVFGSDVSLDLDLNYKNHGLIKNMNDLNALYNECSIGLCLSMTNPSRIPFEFMASGVVPVDLYRYNNLFDYAPGTALLAYQSPSSIAEAMLSLLDDENYFQERQDKCIDFVSSRTLDWEMEVIANAIIAEMYGKKNNFAPKQIMYTESPYISNADKVDRVTAFCAWQRSLAQMESSTKTDK